MLPEGGRVSFLHRLGSDGGGSSGGGVGRCENVDAGEGVRLTAYWQDAQGDSVDCMAGQQVWSSGGEGQLEHFKGQMRSVSLWLTPPTNGYAVVLWWQQLRHSGAGYDWWMLDDIRIDSQSALGCLP